MKNKKGFTMVELLTTLAIVAVLTTLAIMGVSGVRKSLEKSYYRRIDKLVVAAGMDYYNDHKGERPIRVGQSNKVALADLQSEDYIEQVKDYAKEVCDPNASEPYDEKSYVVITKTGEKKYDYKTYLNCPNYKNKVIESTADPNMGKIINCDNILQATPANIWTNQDVILKAKKPSKIESFDILKQTAAGWVKFDSDNHKEKTITISEPGISKYRIIGRGANGVTCQSRVVEVKIDKTPPTCGEAKNASDVWTKKARTINQVCNDTGGSNCARSSYNNTYLETTKRASVTIADKAGNEKVCSYNVYIDITPPTCGKATGASTTWTNSSRTIKLACADNESGCEKSSYQRTFSSGTTAKYTETIKDKVGNTQSCIYDAYFDKTAPTGLKVGLYKWKNASTKPANASGLSAYPNNTWFSGKVYTNASGATDSGAGGVYYQYTTTGKTSNDTNIKASARNIEAQGVSYIKYRACDKLGNCSSYSSNYTIKLDRTNPTGSFTSGQIAAGGTAKLTCSDALSGIKSGNTSKKMSGTSVTISSTCTDNAGNSKAFSKTYKRKSVFSHYTGCTKYYDCSYTTKSCSGWAVPNNGRIACSSANGLTIERSGNKYRCCRSKRVKKTCSYWVSKCKANYKYVYS